VQRQGFGWFFRPLISLAVLFVFLAFLLLWSTAISDTTASMAGNVTAAHPTVATAIWGWSWFSSGPVVVSLVVLFFLGIGLYRIGKAWVVSRFAR